MASYTVYINFSTGNDTTGNGTIGAPYRTLWRTRQLAYLPGDIVTYRVTGTGSYFADGISLSLANYAGVTVIVGPATAGQRIRMDPSGWTNGQVSLGGGFTDENAPKVTLNYLDISGSNGSFGWLRSVVDQGAIAFPDGKSALMLVSARLRHMAGTKWGLRKYMDVGRLKELKETEPEQADQTTVNPTAA